MPDQPPDVTKQAYVIDVTRIASRIGRGALTGIDRVELAYMRHLSGTKVPAMALLRTRAGVVLLGPTAFGALAGWADGAMPVPLRQDLMTRLTRRQNPYLGRVETALRPHAILRAPLILAGALLRRRLPEQTVYFNTGHSNLTHRMMRALHSVPGLRIAVLLHDTIPLDHPAFTRADQIDPFRRKLVVVAAHADLIIHTAHSTRILTEAHLARLGRVPMGVVAPLGVEVATPDPAALPTGLDLTTPFFVAVGTIEPRKNHAFLLDLWDNMATGDAALPHLYILGNRGWATPALLDRLDRGQPGVTVLPGLGDAAMMALVSHARALLFPSHVEGFGLPPYESAAMGTPVVCAPIPAIREGLGDYPVYLDIADSYSWTETIMALSTRLPTRARKNCVEPPSWREHFKTVLNAL